ncbi:Hypothetical protein NTJ_09981 [Nesidiocoris tenuis]|uniref:GLTSCR protein conserved domain-containing protein n=1 Tax=Nesidiocoris tenuis TaxID=355587 RepID=A0ABN7AYD5_9HEMI|nr:Hypothetical protein NTJ_09981 [Nesidiocoris tenuis]
MNKLAIQETFPPGIVGREIVLAQMCHHYRRISSAKARVDTNLFKPLKPSLSRPLSAEVSSIVQRSLSPRSPPKHRKCLKYENDLGEFHFKPTLRSQGVESRLRSTPEVYHPAVKSPKTTHHELLEGHQQATQTSLENSLVEEESPKTRDEAVQTSNQNLYRPVDLRSVQFLRDITNDALQQRAFTSASLNRIFLEHQYRNAYSLTQELMDRELEELRRQLGMLPRHHPFSGTVSDSEALDALDSLVLDPRIKEQVIQSLRLSRDNDARKRRTFKYFDRLKGDEDEQELPIKEISSSHYSVQPVTTLEDSEEPLGEDKLINVAGKLIDSTNNGHGWDAEVEEEDRPITTDSSSEDGEEKRSSPSSENDEEVVESLSDSDAENAKSDSSDVETESDEEVEEVTQRESTASKQQETRSETSKYLDKDDTDPEDSNTEMEDSESVSKTGSKVSIDNRHDNAKNTSQLLPLKLEPLTAKGDKWRTSLEAVKEEPDSTTGQISDLSMASTPSDLSDGEDENRNMIENQSMAGPSDKNEDSPPTGTYHSAESIQQTNGATGLEATSSAALQESTSSTGQEIVLEMEDLLAGNDATPLDIGNKRIEQDDDQPKEDGGEELSESVLEVEEDVETVKDDSDDEGEESEIDSEIETVHSGSESDSDKKK